MANNRLFDVVVFGATGFVGQLVCQSFVQQSQRETVKWAIVGRNASKLKALADRLSPEAEAPTQIVADADDDAALRAMCLQTRVVLSTVGPYALHGDRLVKACAETGTHYCDLTGESPWIRRMIDQYQVQALESGAYIVPCCGFDSIPSDLGVYHLQSQAQQRYQHPCAEVNMRLMAAQGGVSGGTIASGLNLVKEAMEDPDLRGELKNPYFLCPDSEQIASQPQPLMPVEFDQDFQEWVTPFVMADVNVRVVLRSNYLQNYAYGTEFRYTEGILTRGGPVGWFVAQGLKLGLDGLVLATAIAPLWQLLETTILPKPGQGPSAEAQDQGFYDLRFVGKTADGQVLKTQVKGDRDPGYGSTAKLITQASLCLAKDLTDCAQPGGFWTPASLMGSQLLKRLPQWAGVTFTVLN
ncbi:saccharopine dehydrogenase family protein [Leptolyngbya iicbica]|uniref:Saccharopine dehydrogenase n=2 Tax=Cyanophyceae TaxID=3028117 RepID=A0A4Q7EGN7_9CYAN|nr:saccharopine dehydrogenase NADP-binding domain-containing protein [Leptolyngbya sp. LK]RZM82473.1 saccharopine dehydrogenase [Leptolyngbya sp. LK]